MSVKTEVVEQEPTQVIDDMSEEKSEDERLAELREKLAAKTVKKEDMPPKIVEEKKRSIEFGVVGSGQSGSRLSASFHALGYPAICFNTAPQDLEHIQLPEDNKYLLEHGLGGAAKDLDIGREAAEKHRDGINQMVHDKLDDAQVLVLCLSLGGGSGAGSCETMIDVLSETGKPIVVMTVLPMSTDDAQTKNNALHTLSKLADFAKNKVISNLIVVDNAKIETIYNDVGIMDFFKVSNKAIVEPIHVFNEFSRKATEPKGIDSMEFAKIFIDGEGLTVYGEMTVEDYEDSMSLAEAVVNNLDSGLLASGFDLKQTRYAGAMFIANERVWNKIPNGSVNMAMSLVKDVCGHEDSVFKGTYVSNDIKEDVVKVYSMFSGLGLPDSRVSQLKSEAKVEAAKAKDRSDTRNLSLTLDSGVEQTQTEAERIKSMIKKKSSKFGKTFGAGMTDLRKKK